MSEMRAEWGRGMSLDHRDRDYLSLMLAVTITTVIGSFKVANYWLLIFLLIPYLFTFYRQKSNK